MLHHFKQETSKKLAGAVAAGLLGAIGLFANQLRLTYFKIDQQVAQYDAATSEIQSQLVLAKPITEELKSTVIRANERFKAVDILEGILEHSPNDPVSISEIDSIKLIAFDHLKAAMADRGRVTALPQDTAVFGYKGLQGHALGMLNAEIDFWKELATRLGSVPEGAKYADLNLDMAMLHLANRSGEAAAVFASTDHILANEHTIVDRLQEQTSILKLMPEKIGIEMSLYGAGLGLSLFALARLIWWLSASPNNSTISSPGSSGGD